MQKRAIVEALLDSETMRLVMSSKFATKQGFKLKKVERLIENTVEVNIFITKSIERGQRLM